MSSQKQRVRIVSLFLRSSVHEPRIDLSCCLAERFFEIFDIFLCWVRVLGERAFHKIGVFYTEYMTMAFFPAALKI